MKAKEYAPGMRVLIRGEEWRITKVETNDIGNKTLHCHGISPLVKERDAIFLVDLEKITIVDPEKIRFVLDDSNSYMKSRLYIESRLRQKIPTDSAIHLGDQAVMDPMPYQLEPAQMALRRPRQRILIADSVGLGKTLEAGILMAELMARGKGKRILVVTVKSMMAQFQKEMWDRFTIPLVRLDSQKIQRIRSSLPANYNPFFYYDKTIVSIDTLKKDVEYRVHLENAYWDIIVIDEAQNVADRQNQAQRARLAKLLAERSDTMILLSATPHDGKPRSFASLMNMLDPTAIADPDHYQKEDIQGLFIRRFKKDVKDQVSGAFLERHIVIEKAKAGEAEEKALRYFTDMELLMDGVRRKGSGQLFKTTLLKALLSSPMACLASIWNRIGNIEKRNKPEDIKDRETLTKLQELLLPLRDMGFSKYDHLLQLLRSKDYGWEPFAKDDRIVIFTERIETMKYVAAKLREDLDMTDEQIVEMSGEMSDEDQQKIVDDFGRTEAPIRILVASDVASEGLNLHYLSHRMIHFDIPWSLIVFQQRNGRIDRYGQKKRPDIRYMMTESENEKIADDNHILELLTQKEKNAKDNIGDPTSILGKGSEVEEVETIGGIMENGARVSDLENAYAEADETFDLMDMLLGDGDPQEAVEKAHDVTLFSCADYLKASAREIGLSVEEARGYSGMRIALTDELRRRLGNRIPEEAMPAGDWLRLSDDPAFCAKEMQNNKQKGLDKNSWSEVQYLWPMHPLMGWIHDKMGQLYHREEAPLLETPYLGKGEILFLLEGSIPNRKSTPVVDEWFAILAARDGSMKTYSLEEALRMTGLSSDHLINRGELQPSDLAKAQSLLPPVIELAKKHMQKRYEEYQAKTTPLLDEEVDKLAGLQDRKKKYIEDTLFRRKMEMDSETKKTDKLFDQFSQWVKDTMTIEDNPYLCVTAALIGGK